MQNHLIIIQGPTAVGKTAVAVKLAQALKTEILSADARQFYKEMNIGTAKPNKAEMKGVVHHFIDHLHISQNYSAGIFEKEALALLERLFLQHKSVILCGGSGMYINAVCKGLDDFPKPEAGLRKQLNEVFLNEGIKKLQDELLKLDPVYYGQVDINNQQRLIRALEVCLSSGKPYSSFRTQKENERNFRCLYITLRRERTELYSRIDMRVDKMMEQGLLQEAKQLFADRGRNALETVGYAELFDHFEGKTSLEEAIKLIKQHSRNYAKRQMTWFRKHANGPVFHPEETDQMLQYLQKLMN